MGDCLTLTVNSRLARWLLFNHGRQQAQAGLEIWETPTIYSIADWLKQAWLQSWPDRYVLTELQSKYLWQKIIREDPETPDLNLLHIQGTASHAFNAYQLIHEYRLPNDPAGFDNYTEETQAFRRWMTKYQEQLSEWKALDPSELLDAVSERMKQEYISLPEEITFHGFDEITPQMQDWLNFLQKQNIPIHFKPFKPFNLTSDNLKEIISQKQAAVQKYEDANEEVTQCARWVRSKYKEGKTIGIVVPKLEEYRNILEREFKAELAPASVYPWEEKHIPFNISLGTPLSHEPMVHLALLLLSQQTKRIPLLTFSTLITSPFLKLPETEKQFRRDLDWKLRGGQTTHVFLPQVLDADQRKRYPALTVLLDALMSWLDDTSFRLPSEWARGITSFLKKAEWPTSSETLSSLQYQILSSWNECLDALSTLDRISEKINRHQAVAHLSHIVGETLFQPQTHEEPIQVVGLLESAGMEFDYLWILGCDAETLPSIPSPNPFLPFMSHQKPLNLPHSTAEWELMFSEKTLYRLAHACNHLVFSYPAWQVETEMTPSPLLTSWILEKNSIEISASSKLQDHPDFIIDLESIRDYIPISVSLEEIERIQGGTGILKNQAECPFRAFAVHRLSSKKNDFSELDMDSLLQGSLVHKIMELFWNQVQTSEHLHELHETNKLLEQIRGCIDEGMLFFNLDIQRQKAFFELEHERLTILIHEWMEYERERSHFKVLDTECEVTVQLSDLPLKLKVDRIDQTSDKKTILIDYKTGIAPNTNKWFGERIEEPQLPLYSMEVNADGIAFANIRKSSSRYRGLSREEGLIPRLESNLSKENPELKTWDDLRNFWKVGLGQLASEFLQGNLKVSPLHGNETCKYCNQVTLCRKTELLNHQNGEDE